MFYINTYEFTTKIKYIMQSIQFSLGQKYTFQANTAIPDDVLTMRKLEEREPNSKRAIFIL